jgi:hypothetical protein
MTKIASVELCPLLFILLEAEALASSTLIRRIAAPVHHLGGVSPTPIGCALGDAAAIRAVVDGRDCLIWRR